MTEPFATAIGEGTCERCGARILRFRSFTGMEFDGECPNEVCRAAQEREQLEIERASVEQQVREEMNRKAASFRSALLGLFPDFGIRPMHAGASIAERRCSAGRRADLSDPDISAAWQAAQAFIELVDSSRRPVTFWLHGPPGRGKSAIASAIVQDHLRSNAAHSAVFCTAHEITELVNREQDYQARIKALTSARLVAIDDLRGRLPEYQEERLFHIVAERYEARRPLVITSQADPMSTIDQFRSSERKAGLQSRMSHAIDIRMPGPDWRNR